MTILFWIMDKVDDFIERKHECMEVVYLNGGNSDMVRFSARFWFWVIVIIVIVGMFHFL